MNPSHDVSTLGWSRRLVAATAVLIGTLAWSHSLAALLRPLAPGSAPLAAGAITIGAVLVALAGVAAWPRRGAALVSGLAGVAGAVVIDRLYPGALIPALALAPVGAVVNLAGAWLSRRIPVELERWPARHRLLTAVWLVIALAAVVQVGRLSTFMTDSDFDWFLSTRHPFLAKHECANAYFYAAELNLRGEPNVYDAVHYPGLNREAVTDTKLVGMTPEDPFQYAPQFLLWPTLAIFATTDYTVIRLAWFGLQVALLMGAVLGLAAWVGGRAGKIAAYGSPALLVAFPVLHNLQYGQFHFAAVALGVLGLLAFERGRRSLGGALLAVSILSKLFPAVLLVPLVVQRRWRELAWTAAAGGLLTGAALLVVGPAPFVAFFDYHLPRLSSGEAFAFGAAWPELRELIVTSNQGMFGLVTKLAEMGLPATAAGAAWANRLFLLGVLVTAALMGTRLGSASRFEMATSWLALAGLASLASTGAFADYVPLTCVWLLGLLAAKAVGRPRVAVGLGVCAVLQLFILGTVPVGSWAPIGLMLPLSAVGVLAMMALFVWTLVSVSKGEVAVRSARWTGRCWATTPGRAAVPVPISSDQSWSSQLTTTRKRAGSVGSP